LIKQLIPGRRNLIPLPDHILQEATQDHQSAKDEEEEFGCHPEGMIEGMID
jgi:hypothetical protein